MNENLSQNEMNNNINAKETNKARASYMNLERGFLPGFDPLFDLWELEDPLFELLQQWLLGEISGDSADGQHVQRAQEYQVT